ncbi:hypothetical protein [Candidatus Thiodiazotropha sp. CDECU1]|uniref:hypothetical protein n=1 Tax=Candidatus Thiodiazotropha sp. CDECU1 TaxID=3065865 RepID=UPI00292CC47E|nr:hypothetical protein [Candidatus Thiodiazotropha sp. CDECU1]
MVLREWVFVADLSDIACLISFKPSQCHLCQSKRKRGYITDNQPPILERLQIDTKHWLYMTQHFESRFKGLVGMSHRLMATYRKLEYRHTPNLGAVRLLLT